MGVPSKAVQIGEVLSFAKQPSLTITMVIQAGDYATMGSVQDK